MRAEASSSRDTAPPNSSDLIRVLGIFFALAAVIGGSVGQGILRTPGIVAGAAPVPSLILLLWAFGGLIAAINAVPQAELGAALPHAGGPYVYVRRAFGTTAGAVTGWSDWLVNISGQAFMAVVVAEFLVRLGLEAPVKLIAPLLIGLFYLVNLSHTRIAGSSQTLGSALKGLGLILLVALLFLFGRQDTPSPPPSTASAAVTIAAFAVAMRAIQNTYDGWNNCVYFSEEMTNPSKQIPQALFGGIALVTLLYLLVNAAMLHVLTPAQMAGSTFPAADALEAAIGPEAAIVLTVFGVITVGAILNLNVMWGPRVALAMSRDGVLPRPLSRVSRLGSPMLAMSVGSGIAIALAATGTYEQLIAFNVALGFVVNSAVCLSAIQLRRSEPDLVRPWRMRFFPLPAIAALAINIALLSAMIGEDPFHSLAGIAAVVAIGLVTSLVGRRA